MSHRLRSSNPWGDSMNIYPLTPGTSLRTGDPSGQKDMAAEEIERYPGMGYQDNEDDLLDLDLQPPLTPCPVPRTDTAEGTSGRFGTSMLEPRPSLAVKNPPSQPAGGPRYTGMGPNLSEDESDEDPAPLRDTTEKVTSSTRKRRVSSSPEARSKRPHLDTATKTSSNKRESRPRRREGGGPRLSSSSCSSSDASVDMNQPPPTPKPIKSEKSDSSGSQSCKTEAQVKKQGASTEDRRPLRRRVPKTPSPTGSGDRPSSPVRRKVSRISESPELDRPPPTPSFRKQASPLPSTSKLKAEPKTPRPEERSPPSNALVAYSASEAEKRRAETTTTVARRSPTQSSGDIDVRSYPTPGTIKSVKMFNIMCHSKFEKSFSQNFNFIVGDNGSGKSAILSGIVAGLGGRAFDTGRANSMKAIIKNGQPNAKIEIVMNNYPSKIYGNEIRIVRYLSREGSSRYQIMDASGQYRRLGRDELSLVLSKLNIQVDNPLAILHQEMSRNFLRTKDPNVLYSYFYRALLLNSCENLLKKATEDLHLSMKVITGKKHLRDDLREKEQDLKKDVEMIEQMRKGKQTLLTLEKEYLWALVKESEQVLTKAKKELDAASVQYETAKCELEAINAQSQEYENNLASHDERWQAISRQLVDLNAEYEAKRREAHDIKVGVSEINGKMAMTQKYIKQHHVRLQRMENKLFQYEANMATEFQRKQQEVEIKKQNILQQRDQFVRQLEQLEYDQAQMLPKVEIAEKTEQEQDLNIRDIKRKLDTLEQELKEYERTKSSKYDAYGREMGKIVEKINKEKNWIKKPRGPLGTCITVRDEKWAPLVEYILGSSVSSFAVDNTDDKKRLDKIIEDVYKTSRAKNVPSKPPICLMNFGEARLNVSKGKAVCDYPTVLDVIDFVDDDYVVFNWMIDSASIERVLLFENYQEACGIMRSSHLAPKTTLRGFSLDEYMFTPDPNYKALAQHKLKPPRFLKLTHQQASTVCNTEPLEQEFRALRNEYQMQSELHEKMKEEVNKLKKTVSDYARTIHSVKGQINNLDISLKNVESSLFNITDVAIWRDEIEEEKAEIQRLEQKKIDDANQLHELNARLENLQYSQLEAEIQRLITQQRQMQDQKENAEVEMAGFKRDMKNKETLMNEANRKKVEAMKKYSEAEKQYKEKLEEAMTKCPKKITKLRGTSQEIKLAHDSLSTELQKNQKRIQEYDYVKRLYKNAKDNAGSVDREIKLMEALINLLEPQVKMQRDHFRVKTLDYGIAVKTCFNNLITSRGYQGDLAISHEDKTLMCYVSLDTSADSRARRNFEMRNGQAKVVSRRGIMEYAHNMSGGERSFTTICFLISCWQLMDMPFYILDEFDVFMDPFNRRISQYIIMNLAHSKPNAQFFIFTPLQLDCQAPPNSLILRLRRGENEEEEGGGENRRRMIRNN